MEYIEYGINQKPYQEKVFADCILMSHNVSDSGNCAISVGQKLSLTFQLCAIENKLFWSDSIAPIIFHRSRHHPYRYYASKKPNKSTKYFHAYV